MLTSDFDYELPPELIAQQAAERGESRLLVVGATGGDRHAGIRDLPRLLDPGDLLVVNDTRVIPARLFARRVPSGGRVELLLIERVAPREWLALANPARRLRPGGRLAMEAAPQVEAEIVSRREDGAVRLRFSEPLEPRLEELGHVPLPPYIRRPDEAEDRERYQTVYARAPGAIAAPTAGLHFDHALLGEIESAGVKVTTVTLHVGLGTFKPVTAERAEDHRMEAERYEIPAAAAAAIEVTRAAGGRVVAVGTTVVRALESAALEGDGEVTAGAASTRLFITPGFRFQVADRLLTNFHLPRSTLLMLVSAFAGRERVLAAYDEAIERRYRFYSYGDAMLLVRADLA